MSPMKSTGYRFYITIFSEIYSIFVFRMRKILRPRVCVCFCLYGGGYGVGWLCVGERVYFYAPKETNVKYDQLRV